MPDPTAPASPLFTGAVLLGARLPLRRRRAALSLPRRPEIAVRDGDLHRAARRTRDVVASARPATLTASLGRTPIVAGAGLLPVRLLDMAVADGAALY